MTHSNPDFMLSQMNNDIATDDLAFTSLNGKYSFRFFYLGEGKFLLKSAGYIEERSFRQQLQAGVKARTRLKQFNPELRYHLVWDVAEVDGISFISRSFIFSKIKDINKIASVSFIGANTLSKSIGKIISKIVPGVRFLYFMSLEEAMLHLNLNELNRINRQKNNIFQTADAEVYSGFIDRWQVRKEYIYIANRRLKVLYSDKWTYQSPDNNFFVKICVIESNIIYYQCEGFARTHNIEKIYEILGNIMYELGFNATNNKFYGILNLRKLKGVTLGGRKLTEFYEKLYRDRIYMVALVPSNVIQVLFKVISLMRGDTFGHWKTINSVDEAFGSVLNLREGKTDTSLNHHETDPVIEDVLPVTHSGLVELVKRQQREIKDLQSHQHEQIQKILEITGRMSWDESFSESLLIPDGLSPFNEVYNSLHLLFQDFRDIIREKTEHAQLLKESEDKYRNLINLANDIIAVYQDGNLKFVNSRCKKVLGYSPNEIIGKDIAILVDEKERKRFEEFHEQRTKDNIPWVYETTLMHKMGHQVPVSISVGFLHYENNPALMLIARDITQNKKNDAELERYRNHLEAIIRERTIQLQKEISDRKTAEESDRLKTSFLSNMSHEIRTPMNAIIAFSNFLKNKDLSQPEREEYLNYIQSSGVTLLNLINDIIDISKIEAKQLGIQESYCNVDSLLDELYKYFENHLKRFKKFDVGLLLIIPDRTKNTTIFTDANRLKQILTNLLDNAVKFTDAGSITFGYSIEDSKIVFFVKDTGIGIPANKMDLIFQRFGKIDLSGRNFSGTGLGLAISHNLATILKGRLWVESKEGAGATFRLQLLYQQSEQLLPLELRTVKQHGTGTLSKLANRRILVVEDEDLNFKVLQIALQQRQVRVVRAKDGKEAVDKLSISNEIELVLMDIQMPVMDGYEAMSLIKKQNPELPVIAQTAFAMMEERKRCLEIGFDDYISKPINIPELYEKIERHLKSEE